MSKKKKKVDEADLEKMQLPNEQKESFRDRRKRRKEEKKRDLSFSQYPLLSSIKPREKLVFHSDYFEIDNQVATIMSFFHMQGAMDSFPAFWSVALLPTGLKNANDEPDTETVLIGFKQVRRMSRGWIDDHQSMAEGVSKANDREQSDSGTNSTKTKSSRKVQDLEDVAIELANGGSYLQCYFKIMVKSPTLEKLDFAVSQIEQLYTSTLSTVSAAPLMGSQRDELSNLFQKNAWKPSKPFYFTSQEFAGTYGLVTHGIEDEFGEYVGHMIGDINNAAVLFEVDRFRHHVVVANDAYFDVGHFRTNVANCWGSKISQSSLFHNRRVVHIILDGTNMDKLGPRFDDMTFRVDMSRGEVNMFEMFGDVEDEMSIFATQMQKLILMAEQAYHSTDDDRSVIENYLEDVARKFYIAKRMWFENAIANRHRLRVTGIPHEEVPKLELFVAHLDQEYTAANREGSHTDPETIHAINVLRGTFKNLLSTNGDLFNQTTSNKIDGAKTGRRVIYDFSGLAERGKGVAMAQLVNIIGFAIGNLGSGDTIIIHGTEMIDNHKRLKDFLDSQFDRLYRKGGRVVFLYNDFDKMINDKGFCHFDRADYTIFGRMSENQIEEYQTAMGQDIPKDLITCLRRKDPAMAYLRRDYTNVVFEQDLHLGIDLGSKGVRL